MKIGRLEITRVSDRPGAAVELYPQVGLADVVQKYDIVGVSENAIVVTERGMAFAEPNYSEIGLAGGSFTAYGRYLREDYNPELRGELGLRKYDQMRKSDAQIRMSLKVAKAPVLSAHWYLEAASESRSDVRIRDFIWDNLTKWTTSSWPQTLVENLFMLDFGWYAQEKVFAKKDGKVIWQKFAPRHPLDCARFEYDKKGGPVGIIIYDEQMNEDLIPIDKLMVFTHEREAGNMTGVSALRSAYPHWYFKHNLYKIDAIQKERHAVGIPVIKLPPGFKPQDKIDADNLGRNLRANEKAHIVLPPLWEVLFAKLEGQPVNVIESIDHHNKMIINNVVAPFLNETGESTEKVLLYLKSSRFIAEIIRDVYNKWAFPELVAYNWGQNAEIPELKVRRIGDVTDWRTLSFAIRNLIGAGALRVDKPLLAWIREELDLPKEDETSLLQSLVPGVSRDVVPMLPGSKGTPPVSPPGLPKVGLPRQTPAKPSNGAGSSRVGQDTSGG